MPACGASDTLRRPVCLARLPHKAAVTMIWQSSEPTPRPYSQNNLRRASGAVPASPTSPSSLGGSAAGSRSFKQLFAQPNAHLALEIGPSHVGACHGADGADAAASAAADEPMLVVTGGPRPQPDQDALGMPPWFNGRSASLQTCQPVQAALGSPLSQHHHQQRQQQQRPATSSMPPQNSSTEKYYTVQYIGVAHGELGILTRRQVGQAVLGGGGCSRAAGGGWGEVAGWLGG